MTSSSRAWALVSLSALLLAPVGARAQTVADVLPSMSPCTSGRVAGLSRQLVRAQVCAYPSSLVAFSHPNISAGSSVNAYGSPEMVAALLSVAAGNHLVVNDAFRTVVMQYAYYATDRPGGDDGCYGPVPAGQSRHEWGNAVDIGNYSAVRGADRCGLRVARQQ